MVELYRNDFICRNPCNIYLWFHLHEVVFNRWDFAVSQFQILSLFLLQLTSGMIEELDSLLHTGTEITAIYEELTKTLPNDYLEFANVSYSLYCRHH